MAATTTAKSAPGARANSVDEPPVLNRFIQATSAKGEALSYQESTSVLAAVKSVDEKGGVPKDVLERQLARLLQFGNITISTVEPLLRALQPGSKESGDDRSIVRILYYLVQLVLGDGYAGTPMPTHPSKGNAVLPKAVDRFGPEVLSLAWSDLSSERSPFMRKQGAMRALAALAHASLTSKPDDPTYPAGVFVTLQSLLERIDQQRESKKSLMAVLQQERLASGSATLRRKNQVTEFKSKMETWGLLRLAFSAARVALSKSGIAQISVRSFNGVSAGDPLCARHSLALAALVARDPQGSGSYIQSIGPLLRTNVDTAKATGVLFPRATKDSGGAAPTPGRPTVLREDGESSLTLRDTWARVYLARGCAAAIQSGHIAGDLHGAGAVFWEALQLLAIADPSDLVRMEAIKAMFGAPYPHPESLRKRPQPPTNPEQDPEGGAQPRVFGASWHMIMSVADAPPDIPAHALAPGHEALAVAGANDKGANGNGQEKGGGGSGSLFGQVVSRLLAALTSRSRPLIAAACRAAGVIFESHAWCYALSGGQRVGTEAVYRTLRVLQNYLISAFNSEALSACERSLAGEALVWAQLPPADNATTITPQQLLRVASQGGLATHNIVKALFADPWPEALVASFLCCLHRRQRCAPALAPWCLQLAGALAGAAPLRTPRDVLQALWDAAPGPVAVRSALELLGCSLPPITQPPSTAPVEVKVLATEEEQAFELLRGCATWWLGEHANAVAGAVAWKGATKASVKLAFMQAQSVTPDAAGQAGVGSHAPDIKLDPLERVALGAAVHAPCLSLTIAHLQRAMFAGSWEVRLAAAQALAKVAVRSPEPFRIQAYAVLASAVQPVPPVAGSGCLGAGVGDPLGLVAVVRPVMEVLDAMYAGEIVLAQQFNAYGAVAAQWPKPVLAAVQRRHEWLMLMIGQRIGAVPRDTFFPLGRRSRLLLRPDEPPEPEVQEEEEDKAVVDAAAAAAAALTEQQQEQQQQYDEQYDQQYYDQYYDGQDGAAHSYEADPLAKWQAGDYTDSGGAVKVGVAWRPLEDDATDRASSVAHDHDGSSYVDEEDTRWGTMLYGFSAEAEEEVSLPAGARVKIQMDLGDWLHVVANSGQAGLVPTSYVQEDAGGMETASQASSFMPVTAAAAGTSYGHDYSQYGGGGGYDVFGDAADGYGASSYEDQSRGGATYQAYGTSEDDSGFDKKGGGGFDDFGAALAAAAEARAQAQARAAQLAAQMQQQASIHRTLSKSSTSSSFSTAQRSLQPSASIASSVNGAAASYTPPPNYQASTMTTEPAAPATSASPYGFEEEAPAAGWTTSGWGEAPVSGFNSIPPSETYPSTSVTDVAETQQEVPPSASFTATASPEPELATNEAAAAPAAGRTGVVLYEFSAEMENELSVRVGDALDVLGEMDGWYTVRLPDGTSGLVPANYVQLN